MGRYLEIANRVNKKRAVPDRTEDQTSTVEIYSEIFGTNIWFALDENVKPEWGDERAMFFASELPALKSKTPAQLKEIQKVKRAFGYGTRVRQ